MRQLVLTVIACFILTSSIASAQPPDGDITTENNPVTMSGILNDADCPLSEEQKETIEAIRPNEGRVAIMEKLGEMLNDQQVAALRGKLGSFAEQLALGREEKGPNIRNLFEIFVFEKEGVTITEKQVRSIPQTAGDYEKRLQYLMEHLTPRQQGALQKYLDYSR